MAAGRDSRFFSQFSPSFRRAGAAEQRYEQLTRASAAALARDGIVRTDLPRRIFEEFYSLSLGNAEDTWL